MDYVELNLLEMLGTYGEDKLQAILSCFILLAIACHKVQEAQFIIGGKTVYIECASNPKLYDFYSASQFVQFGQRDRDTDEISESPVLVQMLKYFRE